MHGVQHTLFLCTFEVSAMQSVYCMAGYFGEEFILADWQF